jgi:hypothetical protein
MPVSRLREAVPAASILVSRFGGRSQVGKDHAQQQAKAKYENQPKIISL